MSHNVMWRLEGIYLELVLSSHHDMGPGMKLGLSELAIGTNTCEAISLAQSFQFIKHINSCFSFLQLFIQHSLISLIS